MSGLDLPQFRECALFAGGGGGLHGSHLLGWRPVRPTGWAGTWAAEPVVDRVDHGVADRRDRLAALGNGQVPIAMAYAVMRLAERAAREELDEAR